MADVTVAPQQIAIGGLVPSQTGSLSAANVYEIKNDGKMFIHVVNGGGGDIVCTIATPGAVGGNAIADRDVTVSAGTEEFIGPFPPWIYNDEDGNIGVSFDVITSVTLGGYRVG